MTKPYRNVETVCMKNLHETGTGSWSSNLKLAEYKGVSKKLFRHIVNKHKVIKVASIKLILHMKLYSCERMKQFMEQ